MPRVRSIRQDLSSIRSTMRQLQRALDRLAGTASRLERSGTAAGADRDRPRRKLTLSPKRKSQLKLQGQYMGYMRQLEPREKERVRAAKERGGYGPAIKLARSLASRG
jgi:hypothetical protein